MTGIASRVALAGPTLVSNVWLFSDGQGRRFLIDTGYLLERPQIALGLWWHGVRRPGDLQGIILTHRHSDHAANARWLRARFRCPVYIHRNDAPMLSGECRPASLRRGVGLLLQEIMCFFEDRWPARSPVDGVFDDGPWQWGFTIIPAFGHTEGSVMIYHQPSATLFSGDAILAGIPHFRFIPRLGLGLAGFSVDIGTCHALTMRFLADPPPVATLCAGHGPAMRDRPDRELHRWFRAMTAGRVSLRGRPWGWKPGKND